MYLSTIVSMYVLYDTQNNIHLKKIESTWKKLNMTNGKSLKRVRTFVYYITGVKRLRRKKVIGIPYSPRRKA